MEWFSPSRLAMEGPFADLVEPTEDGNIATDGPLRGSRIPPLPLWCGLLDGKLWIALKDGAIPPGGLEGLVVRGEYRVDESSTEMSWVPHGSEWEESELSEVRLLSEPAYQLYAKAPPTPRCVFLFGAGASYGSDPQLGIGHPSLPPLGKDLFPALVNSPEAPHWKALEGHADLFRSLGFEKAAADLEGLGGKGSWARDLELAEFFSKFSISLKSNLYLRLVSAIKPALVNDAWSGAAITLNYDRLLEQAVLSRRIWPVVKGVTWYSTHVPLSEIEGVFEMCYPHGGCQFYIGQNWLDLSGGGEVVWGHGARIVSNCGATHVLNEDQIQFMRANHHIPLICRYEPKKGPTVANYFIDAQQQRATELIEQAERIVVVGVFCSYPGDDHLWGALGRSNASILYIEPSDLSRERFSAWASAFDKQDGRDFSMVPFGFGAALDAILEFAGLKSPPSPMKRIA
jgi:hypothetical protein